MTQAMLQRCARCSLIGLASLEGGASEAVRATQASQQLRAFSTNQSAADARSAQTSTTSRQDAYTHISKILAHASGADLSTLDGGLKVTYPAIPEEQRLYPRGTVEDAQLDLIRRSNISMPCKLNQRVYGTVIAVEKKRVWVDAGHTTVMCFPKSDLTIENLVSASASVDQRQSSHDVRRGDTFIFRVQSTKSPFGSVWLVPDSLDKRSQQDAIWEEIMRAHHWRRPIGGRILNKIPGGYAVGVGGFVAFLPFAKSNPSKCTKLGVLQSFLVSAVQQDQRRFVVMHPDANRGRRLMVRR